MSNYMQAGKHRGVRVIEASLMPPSASGNPSVKVYFANDAGDLASMFCSLSIKALPYSVEKLRTCGWKGDDVSDLSSCIGTVVDIVVIDDEYNGKITQKVKSVYAQKERTTLAPTDAKAIAAAYMGRIAALSIPSADPLPEPPPPSEADAPLDPDGCPF